MRRRKHWTAGGAVAALALSDDGRRVKHGDEEIPSRRRRRPRLVDVLGTPQPQEKEDDAKVNKGHISLSVVNDFTTAYMFRGILQERNGFIWRPSAEIGFNLYDGEGSAFPSIELGLGVWNSFQSNKTGAVSGPSNLTRTDIYPSLTMGF